MRAPIRRWAGYTHPDDGGTYEFRINVARGPLVDTGSRLIAVPDLVLTYPAYVPVVPTTQRVYS